VNTLGIEAPNESSYASYEVAISVCISFPKNFQVAFTEVLKCCWLGHLTFESLTRSFLVSSLYSCYFSSNLEHLICLTCLNIPVALQLLLKFSVFHWIETRGRSHQCGYMVGSRAVRHRSKIQLNYGPETTAFPPANAFLKQTNETNSKTPTEQS
jgi:hypothetical protein